MKTKITTKLKLVFFGIAFLAAGAVNAQTTTGNVGKKTNTALGTTGGSVRVIDNKGTKKFLQVENGLTSFTDTAPDGGIVTTWQLGGTLTADTTITTGTSTALTIDGGSFNLDNTAEETGAAATVFDGTGYTILVRDETTGNIKKILLNDLVESGQTTDTAAANTLTGSFTITATGMPATASKVWVYRNGAKLISGTDYTTAADTVTVTVSPGTGDQNWVSYTGDFYEVQWVK